MARYEQIAQLPNNEVKCTLCDDIIHNSGRLMEAHLHEKKHKELYMKSLMTTNNIIIRTVDLFCHICNHNISTSELISHVQSNSHQNNYSSIQKLVSLDGSFVDLPEAKSSDPFVYCMICDRSIEFMYVSVQNHITSQIHKEAKAMVLQPLNGIFAVEGHDQYLWCKVCQKFFDNYIEVIFQHVYESEHAKKMEKLLRLISGQNIEIEKYFQDYEDHTEFCAKCKIVVPCNMDNLQSHIKGRKHLKSSS